MKFAKNSHQKNYKYKESFKKNGWRQRIPTFDVDKKFRIINIGANRGDLILFENKLLHKSDVQNNELPRVAFVIRFISNGVNGTYRMI